MDERCGGAKKFNKLISRIARGDETALKEFFAAYGRLIYAAAISWRASPASRKRWSTACS